MKRLHLILSSLVLILITGCGLQPTPSKPKIDLSMPSIQKVRSLADITSVALEWTPSYNERVQGYYIYRGKSGGKLERIATIEDRYSSHYLDKKLQPSTTYVYAVSSYDKQGRESKPSSPVTVTTLPVPEAVPFIEAIDHLPREVKLIWRPHPYARIDRYVIERSTPKQKEWKKIATLQGRLNAEYIDKGLEDRKIYYYRIFAKTCDGILSKPSTIVKASTKPRPSIVKGLQATANLPKKIIITWQPNPEADIVEYRVYKSLFEIGPYVVIAKTRDTRYIDLIDEDGVKRYYKVTAVDKDGLESFKQDVPAAGQTLGKPLPPVIVYQNFDGNTLTLRWESPDHRAVRYEVHKKVIEGFLSSKTYKFTGITDTSFTDSGLVPGNRYIYEVYAIDQNGIKSEPSKKIEIKIPKAE